MIQIVSRTHQGLFICLLVFVTHATGAQIRRVPADTGRTVWGHQEYTRYTGANLCDRAVAEVTVDMHRTDVPDTLVAERSDDLKPRMIPEQVLATAHACADRFAVDDVDPRDLWSLTRLALVLGDDTKARAAIDRRLTLDTAPARRADALARAIFILMEGPSAIPKVNMAQEYLTQLDALAEQKVEQFNARLVFLRHWIARHNVDSIRAYATHAIELSRRMTSDEQNNVLIETPYESLIDLANEAGDLDLQQQLLDQALEDVGAWRHGDGVQWTTRMMALVETRRSLYGKKTRPLNGIYWFNHQDTPRPVPGKVSLLVHVRHTCGVRCYPMYRLIKQLHERYGDHMDITLIAATQGFSPGTGPLSAAEEARRISDYYLNSLKMPTVLLVDETPMSKIDDGRIVRGNSEISAMFANWNGANAILVDTEGRIQWIGNILSRRMFDTALARTLNAVNAAQNP